MTRQADWKEANRRLLEDKRKTHEPPTVEEVEAYFNGTLSPADEERVRELLVYYPDLAAVFTDPFEREEEDEAPPAPVPIASRRNKHRPAFAFAAMLATILATALVMNWGPFGTTASMMLMPGGTRGAATAQARELDPNADRVEITLEHPRTPEEWRVKVSGPDGEIDEISGKGPLVFTMRNHFESGSQYTIDLYAGDGDRKLATYPFTPVDPASEPSASRPPR